MSRLFPILLLFTVASLVSARSAVCQVLQPSHPSQLISRSPQHSGDAVLDLYNTLLDSAQTADGTLHLGLSAFDGKTTGHVSGQGAKWHIDPGTIVRVSFSFRGESWEKLTFEFTDHPLYVQLATDTAAPGSLTISKITYGHDGKVKDVYAPGDSLITNFDRRGLSGGTPIGFYSDLLSNISLPPRLSALIGSSPGSHGPFVLSSTQLMGDKGDQLNLLLSPMTTVPLGSQFSGHCDPGLLFTYSVPLAVKSLNYDSATGRLEMTTGSFVTTLSGGCLAAGGTEFRLASGNQLAATTLALGEIARGQQPHLSVDAANFSASLLGGTTTTLSTVSTYATVVKSQDKSSVLAEHMTVGVGSDGHNVLLMENAHLQFGAVSGQIAFDSADFVNFSASTLNTTLASAKWVDASAPRVVAKLDANTAAISGGLLTFGPSATLPLSTGQAQFGELSIDSGRTPSITGKIVDLEIGLSPDTFIGKDRFEFDLGANSTLRIHAVDNIIFSSQSPGPHGHATLTGPVSRGKIQLGKMEG
jgi:hypothetical protein